MTRIGLGVFGFALMVAYVPGVAGAATIGRWWVLLIFAAVWWGRVRWTEAHATGALLWMWAAVSLLWSPAWHDGVDALLKLTILGMVFAAGSCLDDLRPAYIGAAVGILVSGLLSMAGWHGGLFLNPLFMAEAAVLVAVALLPDPRTTWWALLTVPAIAAAAATTARGALLALGCTGLVVLARRRPWLAVCGAGAVAVILAGAIWLRPVSVAARIEVWEATIRSIVPFGHGFGSFGALMPPLGLVHFEHPHSLPLEIAFELGVPGAILILWLGYVLLRGPLNPERLVLVAFAVEALFAFPDRLPATAGLAALVAGRLAADLPDGVGAVDGGRTGAGAGHGGGRRSAVAGSSDGGSGVVSVLPAVSNSAAAATCGAGAAGAGVCGGGGDGGAAGAAC